MALPEPRADHAADKAGGDAGVGSGLSGVAQAIGIHGLEQDGVIALGHALLDLADLLGSVLIGAQNVQLYTQLIGLRLCALGDADLERVGLVLLDEGGKEMRSIEFADYMKRKMNTVNKRLVFVIGGPYGFSPKVYQAAHEKMSLSKMTFSHQMVRLIFVEQLYRAMNILNGGPYHHE